VHGRRLANGFEFVKYATTTLGVTWMPPSLPTEDPPPPWDAGAETVWQKVLRVRGGGAA